MHSNFVTPPDFVETILILNATDAQVSECAEFLKGSPVPYNVYFYNDQMKNLEWAHKVKQIADFIIDAEISNPIEYFNK